MAINKRLLVKPPSTGITPSEHFGVVLYEGDGSTSHSINGGKFGAAANFNGTSSTIVVPNSIEQPLIFAKEFGVSMWFNLASLPTGSDEDFLISLYQEGYLDIRIKANGVIQGKVAEETTGTDRLVTSANSVISANTWYHVVWTGETNNLILYVNGSSVATGSTWNGTYYHSNAGCRIGSKSGPSYYFNGKIDQTRIFQKHLSSSEVSTLYAETAATVESLDPLSEDTTETLQVLGDSSCIATYRFENDETDLSGNYDGTGTAIQYAAGRYGQAADFNGSSSNVELPTGSPFNDSDTIKSISAWVKADTTSSRVYPFSIGSTTTDDQFFNFGWIPANNYVLLFIRNGSNSNQAYHSASLTADTNWHHIVVQTTGSAVEIYLDGESKSVSSTYAGSGSASDWISYPNYTGTVRANIGTNASFTPQYSNGQIDQVRFFNKALSASEVTTLYNENSLVASYRFEGNANDDMRAYDGTATNVTYEYGLNFTPDFVWIKERTSTSSNRIQDSTRGATKRISSNLTTAEDNCTNCLKTFDTGGFTVGSDGDFNNNGDDYVAWCLKANGGTTSSNTDGAITSTVQANTKAGFSIVQLTIPSDNTQSVGHGLSQAPEMIFIKATDNSGSWLVYNSSVGFNKYLVLNSTAAEAAYTGIWANVNSSTFTTVYHSTAGSPTRDVIAYCFHSVAGYSKFGSYEGNGDANGPIVETGFEPAFVMVKGSSLVSQWNIVDNRRDTTNPATRRLFANLNNAEATGIDALNFLSNGFQIANNDAGYNSNGNTYIYMAFAADPDTEAPTLADSFSTVTYTGDGSTGRQISTGFQPNFVWIKNRDAGLENHILYDSIKGATQALSSNLTNGIITRTSGLTSFDSDGFTVGSGNAHNQLNADIVAWAWKADDNEPTIFGGPALAVYKFEDNGNDVTGGLNLTESNMSYSSSGKFNKAAEFNGNNSSFTNGSITGLPTGTSPVSISYWAYTDTSNQSAGLVGYGRWNTGGTNAGAAQKYFGMGLAGGDLYFYGYYYNASLSPAVALPTGQWNHLVFTFDGTNVKIYLNGSLAGTINRSSLDIGGGSGNLSITIGRNSWSSTGSEHFDGKIDQVRIYNGALAQEQVTELYNETASDNDDLTLGAPPASIVNANANAGFSIVKYEGDGVIGKQVPHGLSAAPDFIVVKSLDSTYNWMVYASPETANKHAYLNLTNAFEDPSSPIVSVWNDTAPTSTVFSVSSNANVNLSGENYIAYCFHSVSGYSKIGSYTGNGSSTSVSVGFQPDWVMWKATNNAENWYMMDSVRGVNNVLYADGSFAEGTSSGVSFTSTGFTVTSSFNQSGRTFIYMAFKIN